MSGTFELIHHDAHGDKAWKRFTGYQFARGIPVAQLAAPEISKAALSMPLAFMQVGEAVSLVAVCGLLPEQNLFIAPDGRWLGAYVPAVFRGYPFKLARSGDNNFALCIDTTSGLLVERDQGEALFNDDATPTETVQQVMQLLVQTTKGQEALSQAATALSQAGVLEPWPIKIKDGDKERDVTGLLRLNEQSLNGLDDPAFLALRKVGGLQVAYAQLLSSANIGVLAQLDQVHGEIQKRQDAANAEHQRLFQPNGGDNGTIDWSRIFNN